MKGRRGKAKRRVVLYFDPETLKRLKVLAGSHLKSMSGYLTELINSQKEKV